MPEMKYVRLERYDEFIFFPEVRDHSDFRSFGPVSAGFCIIGEDEVSCFGRSVSLDLDGKSDDTLLATKQVCGVAAMVELMKNEKK